MTPEQEEQVRRALGAAARADSEQRAGDRLPDDVAARLDGVLAELVDERSAAQGPGRVDELAPRRRRWPQLLVAAAAVAVIVVGGGTVALRGLESGGGDSDSAGGSSAQRDTSVRGEAAPSAASTGSAGGSGASGGSLATLPLPRLHTATLRRDVRRVVTARVPLTGRQVPAPGCALPSLSRGEERIAVRLDGRPATLVVGASRAGVREARVYSCGDTSAPVANTSVPVR